MAASLAVARGHNPRTFDRLKVTPEQYRRGLSTMTDRVASQVKTGDVRYLGAREVHDAAGVRIVHVFAAVAVIVHRGGRIFFDGESTGYRPSAGVPCVKRTAR